MKKGTIVLILGMLAAVIFAGCGSKLDVDKNTIALQKNGNILEAAVEDFSESYYSEEELTAYINEAVDTYVSENGDKSVSVTDSKVENGKAYLTLKYENIDNFSDFTGIESFSGSVIEAQSAGYDFDVDFCAVGDEAGPDTVSSDVVLSADDLKVFIVKDNSDIIVPGTIVYFSAEGTSLSAKDTVAVAPKESDTDESVLVYVLYK